MKLRTGRSDKDLAIIFNTTDRTVSNRIKKVREALKKDFVQRYVNRERSRAELMGLKTSLSHVLFDDGVEDRAHLVLDGTYLYIEKSSDQIFQKLTFNAHKKRNYLKVMMGVATNGVIIFVDGPYPATFNDAKITSHILKKNLAALKNFEEKDVIIADRGFRDCIQELQRRGFIVKCPICTDKAQLTTSEANASRLVTKVRYIVERMNSNVKVKWGIFQRVAETYWIPTLMDDFTIAAALVNRSMKISPEPDNVLEIGQEMLNRTQIKNELSDASRKIGFNNIYRNAVPLEDYSIFPKLEIIELINISFGKYQLTNASSYLQKHLQCNNGNFPVSVLATDDVRRYLPRFFTEHDIPTLIVFDTTSRFISNKKYRVLILFKAHGNGNKCILQYCCECKVSMRKKLHINYYYNFSYIYNRMVVVLWVAVHTS